MKLRFIKEEKGYVAFFVTILILSALLGIAISIVILTLSIQKISANIIKSSQAYYAAEAGIEDSLLRIFDPSIGYLSSNTLSVGGATANITIEKVSTSLTIESQGNASGRIRKLRVKAFITSDEANFYYGVQVGDGGLTMASNTKILGNVYSNGPVVGASNAKICGDLYVAKDSGRIENMKVFKTENIICDGIGDGIGTEDGNVHAHSIIDSYIGNGAYYYDETTISGTTVVGSHYPGSPDPEPESLPFSDIQINKWKDDAVEGGIVNGNYVLDGEEDLLGPIKINGNLTINSSIFTQTGTIWVTGDLIVNSGTAIELDDSYGLDSGVIVVNGTISLKSNVVICGSEGYYKAGNCYENLGSFLMFVSTNSLCCNPASPTISVSSNSNAAIFYTNSGLIKINSNIELKEVTGYALYIDSGVEITYESGLANINFTSGPGGGWKIDSWKEIE
jgi:formylmethanofuran dehydrogenase subunit C